jgi:protein TorT
MPADPTPHAQIVLPSQLTSRRRLLAVLAGFACASLVRRAAAQDGMPDGESDFAGGPLTVTSWTPAFDYDGTRRDISYALSTGTRKRWRICALYPHLKDPYWLSVNYGMVERARRLGIRLEILEAGGYPNLERQRKQLTDCLSQDVDAVILGTVSFDGVSDLVQRLAQRLPVVAAVNDIANDGITAKVGVSWVDMGRAIGRYFALRHPPGSTPKKIAWFPGPKGAGWVTFVEKGVTEELARSAGRIVTTQWGDTGTEAQLLLIEDVLEQHPDIDVIIGSAVTADAAIPVLRARELSDHIQVLADYFTHSVYRGIKRGKVLAAPTDYPVLQGMLAIEQALRSIEGTLTYPHVGPSIKILDGKSITQQDIQNSLAPAWFQPVFRV